MGVSLLMACAPTRGSLAAGPRPHTVAVAVQALPAPDAQTALDDLVGVEAPAAIVARESVRLLKSRGYAATAIERAELRQGAGPRCAEAEGTLAVGLCRQAASIAGATGKDATLLVRLERMELGALRALGRAEIDIAADLVAADGTLLWSGAHRGATHVTTYRARNDWRAHLRDALDGALEELP